MEIVFTLLKLNIYLCSQRNVWLKAISYYRYCIYGCFSKQKTTIFCATRNKFVEYTRMGCVPSACFCVVRVTWSSPCFAEISEGHTFFCTPVFNEKQD